MKTVGKKRNKEDTEDKAYWENCHFGLGRQGRLYLYT